MRSFKAVGWVAGVGGAVLGCYMLSLQVAHERSELGRVKAQIAETERSIRTLQTELGARGRVHQLQHWASAEFGFAPPSASQFLDGEVRLARLQQPAEAPLEAPVRMADAPAPAPQPPRVVQAAASDAPATVLRRAAPAAAERPPAVRRASLVQAPTARERTPPPPRARATPTRAPADRDALLDGATLRDLDARARTERR